MNMTAIRYGDDIIVVDSGMMFPDAELLGVDLVMPDITYLKENQEHVRALILTHGHEDHIGAVPYFLSDLDVPVYGTAFTLALVERRMEEYELEEEPRLNTVRPKQIIEVGPFKIEFIQVTHSIVSAVASGSAAERAGLRRGDVIESFNGEAIHDTNSLRNRVAAAGPGSTA